jgi:cell shape-determining protein MreC
MIVTAALGALLLIVIVGIALFPVTYLFYRKRKRTERQINERTLEIESLKTELVALKSTLDVKLTPLTPENFQRAFICPPS